MPIDSCSFIPNGSDHPHQPLKLVNMVPMFEKPLTPSDVGKLNRLVIPKQHAEKNFPLEGRPGSGDSALLLSFEDEEASGRWWQFRYSYWSSSQSYVLTKGWNRYVKEKGLGAGDIVSFGRHCADSGHWFIGWKRGQQQNNAGGGIRAAAAEVEDIALSSGAAEDNAGMGCRPYFARRPTNPDPRQFSQPFPDGEHHAARGSVDNAVRDNRTTEVAGNSRRLRLFGVNLECQLDHGSTPSTIETSPFLSHSATHHHLDSDQSYWSSDCQFYGNVNKLI
ncbi:B3 domain-containing protein At2g36080-like [Punica granatum]|uniref:B3 domain-containing protein At2g36080-like n=2 Tax=Punica granatum TaxID=22663 RepID=A0A6P8DY61_PUNGR|nr:B3 domain-containing protein At2g36080-like [Punica granatum]PKI47033.1 hypothetical protein CRG98_032572 [Punica granatum]